MRDTTISQPKPTQAMIASKDHQPFHRCANCLDLRHVDRDNPGECPKCGKPVSQINHGISHPGPASTG